VGSLRLSHIHADFHDHGVFVVAGYHVVHVGQTLGVEGRPSGRVRVERHPAHVPSRAVVLQPVEDPSEQSVVVAVGDVDDDFGRGKHSLDRAVSAVHQGREVRHVGGGAPHFPEHAVVRLVADLDPFGGHSGRR
jgi:hypothetical protein